MSAVTLARAAAQLACDRWSAELQKNFGKAAGDVRYTKRGKGEPGTPLNTAYLEFARTQNALAAAIDAERAAKRT